MDDELQTLEMELKRLRPAAPRRALSLRISARLERRRSLWLWGLLLPAAAAAAMLVATLWQPLNSPAPEFRPPAGAAIATADADFKPVAVQNVLYSAEDEGIVTLQDGTAARRERLQYMDTIIWRNPRTNASLKWTVPREEIRVVPVALQ